MSTTTKLGIIFQTWRYQDTIIDDFQIKCLDSEQKMKA